MGRKNNPLAAEAPPPAFANDPTGFWAATLAQNSVLGISSILPGGTVSQSDVAVKGRLLAGQIRWVPTKARWKGCNLIVSLSDTEFIAVLEEGGNTQQGAITILAEKLQFGGTFPTYGDGFDISVNGKWVQFDVERVTGQHDDNEPAIALVLGKDQNEIGE